MEQRELNCATTSKLSNRDSKQGIPVQPRTFVFYHADRQRSLSEGMVLNTLPNGFSRFGNHYAHLWHEALNSADAALRREWHAEGIRSTHFPTQPSRLACLFGANSVAEAADFAKSIEPRPSADVPLFEIHASSFSSHDVNWLDYEHGGDHSKIVDYMKRYLLREISNSCPAVGERRAPRIEVKIGLPCTVGRLVDWVRFGDEP